MGLKEQFDSFVKIIQEREKAKEVLKALDGRIEEQIISMSKRVIRGKESTGDLLLDYCILRSEIWQDYDPKMEEDLRNFQTSLKDNKSVLVVRRTKENPWKGEYFDSTDYCLGVLNGEELIFHLPSEFTALYELKCSFPTSKYTVHRSWKNQTGLVNDNLSLHLTQDMVFIGEEEIKKHLESANKEEKEIFQKLSDFLENPQTKS